MSIQLRDLTFRYSSKDVEPLLDIPEWSLEHGEQVFLHGPSGCGKTTLLNLLGGLLSGYQGQLQILNTELRSLRGHQRDRFRARHLGYVFQQFNLLPYATALDNALLPLRFAPGRRARIGDERAEALRLAAALGLDETQMTKGAAGALSVGQQQRVAVVRALIGAPGLIVADEPTSALDASAQAAFIDTLFTHVEAAGASLLMVSHDERLADRFDRTRRLEDIARVAGPGARPAVRPAAA